jgi:hypothetical protein
MPEQQQEPIVRAEDLCNSAERLAGASWDKFYEHRLLHLRRQWKTHGSSDEASQHRFQTAVAECESTIDEHRKYAEVADRQRGLLDTLKEDLTARTQQPCELSEQHARIAHFQQEWARESAIEAPDRKLQKQWDQHMLRMKDYANALERLRDMEPTIQALEELSADPKTGANKVNALLDNLNWPPGLAGPAPLQTLHKHHEQLNKTHQDAIEQRQQKLRRADKLMGKLRALLRSQATRPVMAVRRDLERYLKTLDQSDRATYQKRLEPIDRDMQELMDWKAFATEPKALELCDSMEQLADKPLAPEPQLKEIRELRRRWFKLGYSPSTEKHGAHFEELTDKASAPCAQLIAKNEARLERNQQYAERACVQLEECIAALESQSYDWGKVRQSLADSHDLMERNRWLPREHARQIRERYQKLQTRCQKLLLPLTAEHEKQKRMLLSRAEKLSGQKEGPDQIRQTKLLLERWEQLLKGPNEDELRSGLEQFLNAPMEQLHQQAQQEQEQSQNSERRIQEAIDLMRQWLKLEDESLKGIEPEYRKLLEEIPPLIQAQEPAQHQRGAREQSPAAERRIQSGKSRMRQTAPARQFEDLAARMERHLEGLPLRKQQGHQEALKHYAELCQRLEWSDADSKAQALKALEEGAPMLGQMKHKARTLMESRRDAAIAGKQEGDAEQRRLLCTRLEIYADIPTPEEDLELRNHYLMEQMQRGVRLGAMSKEEVLKEGAELYLEYLAGPVADKNLEQLLVERIKAAMSAPAMKVAPKPNMRTNTRSGRHKGKGPRRQKRR